MGEVAGGELARRPAICGHHKNLRIARLQISRAVEAVDEVLIHFGCVGPLGAFGGCRKRGYLWRCGRDQRSKSDLPSIRSPGNSGWRIFDIGEFGGLAGIHPANIQLRLAIAIGNESDTSSIGRPARGSVAISSGGKRTMFGAIEIDDPQVGDTAIGRDLRRLANVDDALAVGRDLRIGCHLNAENIHGFQPIGIFLSDAGEREEEKKKKKDAHGGESTGFVRQGGLLSRMHVTTKSSAKRVASLPGSCPRSCEGIAPTILTARELDSWARLARSSA